VNRERRILLFASGFAPYAFSENIVSSKLALAFLERGWQFRVISRMDEGPSYVTEWQRPWDILQPHTCELRYTHGGFVARTWDVWRRSARLGFMTPGIRWAGRAWELASHWHRENPFSVVLSRAPTDVGHVPALMFSRQTGIPWIANWNDPPTHLWPQPYTHRLGPVAGFTSRKLLADVFRTASAVTFPSERLRQHVLRHADAGSTKTSVIPHLGLVRWNSSAVGQAGCFRLCHAGNLSGERDPGTLFEGLSRFLRQVKPSPAVELTIIGVRQPETLAKAEKHGVAPQVKITGGLGYLETLKRLSESDVLVLVEAPCEEGIFLPSKVVDYAQVGRPILAISPRVGTMVDLLAETGAGVAADCREAHAVTQALIRLYEAWRTGSLSGEFSTLRLWERFKPEAVLRQYEELFASINK